MTVARAISLVERQVHLFREQRDTLRRELADLIAIARQNDRLFDKSKRLLMQLLEAQTLAEIAMVIDDSIRNDFGLDAACPESVLAPLAGSEGQASLQFLAAEAARFSLGSLLEGSRPYLRPLQAGTHGGVVPAGWAGAGVGGADPLAQWRAAGCVCHWQQGVGLF